MTRETYEQWMKRVDKVLVQISGLDSARLADFPSHALYNDRVTPREAAIECLIKSFHLIKQWNNFPQDFIPD